MENLHLLSWKHKAAAAAAAAAQVNERRLNTEVPEVPDAPEVPEVPQLPEVPDVRHNNLFLDFSVPVFISGASPPVGGRHEPVTARLC